MNKNIFEKIISYAIQSASTDNMQFFKVTPSKDYSSCTLEIPQKEEGFIDHHYRSSQISCGCFLENLQLASKKFDINVKIVLDSSSNPLAIAKIDFSKSTQKISEKENLLFNMIEKRNCNREAYKKEKIPEVFLKKLEKTDDKNINIKITLKEDTKYSKLVDSLFACEKVRFYLKEGHKEFYDTIRYSTQEVEEKKDGLDYRLLGLPPVVAKLSMKLLSNWKVASGIVKIGGITLLSKTSSYDLLHKSQGIIVCTLKKNSKKELVGLGRKFQNIWLEITSQNGSLQPFAPLPFFHYMISNGAKNKFFEEQQQIILSEYEKVEKLLDIAKDQAIGLIFRFGIPKKLKYKSIRKDIKQIINY